MNLSVEVWARHENSSFARSTWERIRWCPSCYNAERTKAMQWMAHLAKHQHWRPEQRATLNALKLRLIGNASAKPTNNLRGDASAVCMWDCFRRATMLEPLVSHLLQRHVPGDFLEAGVFRGGISIYMAALLAVDGALGNGAHQRRMWLADSFSGMPSANYTAEWAARRRSANRSTWQAETLIARDRDTRGLSRRPTRLPGCRSDACRTEVRRRLCVPGPPCTTCTTGPGRSTTCTRLGCSRPAPRSRQGATLLHCV